MSSRSPCVLFVAGDYHQMVVNAHRLPDLLDEQFSLARLVAARALRAGKLRQQAMTSYKLSFEEAGSLTASQYRREPAPLENLHGLSEIYVVR
jgi:hypothetical protein